MLKRMKELLAPLMRWHLIAIFWFAFLVVTGFLLAFRAVKTSGLAQLIDFENVPLLSFTSAHYAAFYWGGVLSGTAALLLALACFHRSLRRAAAGPWLLLACGASIGLAAYRSCPATGEQLTGLEVLAPGLLDGLLVLLAMAAALLFLPVLSELECPAPQTQSPAPAQEPDLAVRLAAIYLLGSASMLIYAVVDHLTFWDPERNGGYRYLIFFAPNEVHDANLVLYSTSLLFASLGGLVSCAGYGIFRLLSRPEVPEGPGLGARDCRRQAMAGSALWTAALMGPWLIKILPEIRAEGAWIMPLGIWGLSFAALVPLYMAGALLLRRDAEAPGTALAGLPRGASAGGPDRQECALLAFLLFPLYPWLRLLRPGHARAYYAMQMLLAAGAVGTLTWCVNAFERHYEFDDWRGMIKAGQLPFLRAFFSLNVAALVYLCAQRATAWWLARSAAGSARESTPAREVLVGAPVWRMCGAGEAPLAYTGSADEVRTLLSGSLLAGEALWARPQESSASEEVRAQARPSPSLPALAGRAPFWLTGARRALVALALSCLVLAAWPFWGWQGVSKNVFARTWEFSTRHKFELGFMHWLLDFDRDGYSSVLHGCDADDWDADVQGGGIAKFSALAQDPDRFEIQDPERARSLPNVVLLYLEGVTPRAISAYGLRRLAGGARSTPHLDALAAEGTRFSRARCGYPSTWDGWFAVQSGRIMRVLEMDATKSFGDRYCRFNNLQRVLALSGIHRWCHPNIRPFTELLVPADERALDWEGGFDSSLSTDEEEQQELWRGDKRNARILRFIDSLKPGERFFISEHMSDTHFPWKRTSRERAKALGFPGGLEFVEEDALLNGAPWDKQAKRSRRTRLQG